VILGGIPLAAILLGAVQLWRKRCRPTICQLLRVLLLGSATGALCLAVLLLFGHPSPRLIAGFLIGAGVALASAAACWRAKCWPSKVQV
jgi:hypothetical protein